MTVTPSSTEWPELLAELRKLTALIGPLQAILAQEAAPGVSDVIEQILREFSRIGEQMARAVDVMEGDRELRDQMRAMMIRAEQQEQALITANHGIKQILTLLGEPMRECPREAI